MSEEITADTTSALYAAGGKIGKFACTTQDALEDGKISLSEWGGIGGALGSAAITIVSKREALGANLEDGLDAHEMADFRAGFIAEYDIDDDDLETSVEKWAGYGAEAVNALAKIILAKKKSSSTTE